MQRWFRSCCAALLLCAFSAPAQAGDPQSAQHFIDGIAKQVLDVLKTDAAAPAKQQKLVGIFSGVVDTPFVAKFVLGPNWRTATPEQQKAYVTAYGPFVLNNYAKKLTRYSGEQYTLKNARQDDDGSFLVTMAIISTNSGQESLVDYRLRSEGGYKLIDIIVEGVSLLATQRSEFNTIVQSKGMDHLIASLKKKG